MDVKQDEWEEVFWYLVHLLYYSLWITLNHASSYVFPLHLDYILYLSVKPVCFEIPGHFKVYKYVYKYKLFLISPLSLILFPHLCLLDNRTAPWGSREQFKNNFFFFFIMYARDTNFASTGILIFYFILYYFILFIYLFWIMKVNKGCLFPLILCAPGHGQMLSGPGMQLKAIFFHLFPYSLSVVVFWFLFS